MEKAYDEIMEKIEVTPEMRRRVLAHIAQEDIALSKTMQLPVLSKYLAVAACFALLLAGTAALPHLLDRAESEPPVMTVPNIEEAASLQELSRLVGFEVTAEFSLPFEIETTAYRSFWNELAEVEYTGGGYSATYRQSLGTDDNSGDYNNYSDTAEILISDLKVTLKGNNGLYVLATWTDEVYAYSLSISSGVSAEDWSTILKLNK